MSITIPTNDQLRTIAPRLLGYRDALKDAMERFDINTPERLAAFLAQCAHESARFSRTVENLNYSAQALRAVFGKYFRSDAEAQEYARRPQAIANRVYANRMGNGPPESGDGYRFRGRGWIQLTGHDNYERFSRDVFGDDRLLRDPEPVALPPLCVFSAGWYWHKNGLNELADTGEFVTITRRINGGTNGLDDRQEWWERCKSALGCGITEHKGPVSESSDRDTPVPNPILPEGW